MIFSGRNRSAISRAKRRIAAKGTFGEGYRYGWTYGAGAEHFLVMVLLYSTFLTRRSRKPAVSLRAGCGWRWTQ
jgi:hypothetical protein